MNRVVALCSIISGSAVWIILSLIKPEILGDTNTFLKNFVNQELLSFLGVVVTITLASAANLHLELNKIEEQKQKIFFTKTREAVRRSAAGMIGMLIIAIAVVVIKPLVCESEVANSFFNGAALLILLFNILVLTDLTMTTFKIEPTIIE